MDQIDPTPATLTWAFLLTAAGAVIAAGIITTLVQLIKTALPTFAARFTGAFMAFIISLIVAFLAGAAIGVNSLDGFLVVFAAWLAMATSAVGIYSTIKTAAGG